MPDIAFVAQQHDRLQLPDLFERLIELGSRCYLLVGAYCRQAAVLIQLAPMKQLIRILAF